MDLQVNFFEKYDFAWPLLQKVYAPMYHEHFLGIISLILLLLTTSFCLICIFSDPGIFPKFSFDNSEQLENSNFQVNYFKLLGF